MYMLDKRKFELQDCFYCRKSGNRIQNWQRNLQTIKNWLCCNILVLHTKKFLWMHNYIFVYLACTFSEIDAWSWRSWLLLTYEITRKNYGVGCYFLCIPWPIECKKPKKKFIDLACILPEIGKVTWKPRVTLTYKVHAWKLRSWLLFLCIPWPIECEKQKKIHRSSMYTTRVRKSH